MHKRLHPMHKHAARFAMRLAGLLSIVSGMGCLHQDRVPKTHQVPPSFAEVYRQAKVEFDNAIFYKPRASEDDPAPEGELLETAMTPLMILELPESGTIDFAGRGLGTLVFARSTGMYVDVDQPVLYVSTGRVRLVGKRHDQITYVWWTTSGLAGDMKPGGVRITLAEDGFPMIWEVLGGDTKPTRLFVSESLEARALDAFGKPADGRKYAVERAVADAPNTVVVDVLPDGPMPMGPYVYLAGTARVADRSIGNNHADGETDRRLGYSVSTILCRCSPSQVSHFERVLWYDLLPLSDLRDLSPDVDQALIELGVVGDGYHVSDDLNGSQTMPAHPPRELADMLRFPSPTVSQAITGHARER